uniref:Uncharacterized protein AlNc14C64G4592 n=1 Tax=Albugo laibachii Nc14 TaxID=890382 RepID=F0WD72_9STRA|nr:conserved hypothetical protein [Albugo laibachii Nc14]|eukprot:CCA19144.1 conserved hypothetical protein [Albugo laibachii Nc14]
MSIPGGRLMNQDPGGKYRIRATFDLFDKDLKGLVVQEEVSTMMRFLGVYPSEKDLVRKVLPEMQSEEQATCVEYDRFEKKMLEILAAGEYQPDDEETLLAAFRIIDKENRGFIDPDVLRELLTTQGTAFREKEIEAFLEIAKESSTGRVYYEDYIALFTNSLETRR